MTTNKTDKLREAFEKWMDEPDQNYKDQASIYWSAFAAGAKYVLTHEREHSKRLLGIINKAWLLLKRCEGEAMEEDWPNVDAAYKMLEKAAHEARKGE